MCVCVCMYVYVMYTCRGVRCGAMGVHALTRTEVSHAAPTTVTHLCIQRLARLILPQQPPVLLQRLELHVVVRPLPLSPLLLIASDACMCAGD